MRVIRLSSETDFGGWREAARGLLADGIPPQDVAWHVGAAQADLFGALERPLALGAPRGRVTVPKRFVDDAKLALCHRDPGRIDLLYRLLWRLQGKPGLLANAVDEDVRRLDRLVSAVRRDRHKMRAFVRFRAVQGEHETYVAWFEPEHRIVEENAAFFVRRFANMRWSILTPERSAHWDGQELRFGEGARREDAPDGDALEEMWRTYFAAIFNPARLKVKAMTSEMPKKYWKNLPEADLIRPLIEGAQAQHRAMVEAAPTEPKRAASYEFAEPDAPAGDALAMLRRDAAGCARCELACHATQTVFGEGAPDAKLMIVGEQPGDREDIEGRPFVGPAGELFDAALAEAGIAREALYLTNAVKHFRFTPRGKRRIHQNPLVGHIEHCRWWLEAERRLIRPRLTLAMGGTAIRALAGQAIPVAGARAAGFTCLDGGEGRATLHPAAILRQPDAAEAARMRASLVSDLREAWRAALG